MSDPRSPARSARRAADDTFRRIDAAVRAGDVEALRALLGNPAGFPDLLLPRESFGPAATLLEYAIYHGPLPLIRRLLELGANPNPPASAHAGFPPLMAAISCARSEPGSVARPDVGAILGLLLAFGADPNQRGVNDWTPLHMAVAEGSGEAVRILLDGGADPRLRARIDDRETPRSMAEQTGDAELAQVLAQHERERRGTP